MDIKKRLYTLDVGTLVAGNGRPLLVSHQHRGILTYLFVTIVISATEAGAAVNTSAAALLQSIRCQIKIADYQNTDGGITAWMMHVVDCFHNYAVLNDAVIGITGGGATDIITIEVAIPYVDKRRGKKKQFDHCPEVSNIKEFVLTMTPPAVGTVVWSNIQYELRMEYLTQSRQVGELRRRFRTQATAVQEPQLVPDPTLVSEVHMLGNFLLAGTWTSGVVPNVTVEVNGEELINDVEVAPYLSSLAHGEDAQGTPGLIATATGANPFTFFFPLYYQPREWSFGKLPAVAIKPRFGTTLVAATTFLTVEILEQTKQSSLERIPGAKRMSAALRERLLKFPVDQPKLDRMKAIKPYKLSRMPIMLEPAIDPEDFKAASELLNGLPAGVVSVVADNEADAVRQDTGGRAF